FADRLTGAEVFHRIDFQKPFVSQQMADQGERLAFHLQLRSQRGASQISTDPPPPRARRWPSGLNATLYTTLSHTSDWSSPSVGEGWRRRISWPMIAS